VSRTAEIKQVIFLYLPNIKLNCVVFVTLPDILRSMKNMLQIFTVNSDIYH